MNLEINAGFIIFFALSIFAAVLQCVADVQMHIYRKKKETPFIRRGLWKYSRHPNYLGEILMWWGVALAFLCVCPSLWYLMAGAVINTAMFLIVSVPMADKRQSRKHGFSEYKKQTRMLLPIKK
jgi:steroid 5-alpha reductase family enzyme